MNNIYMYPVELVVFCRYQFILGLSWQIYGSSAHFSSGIMLILLFVYLFSVSKIL